MTEEEKKAIEIVKEIWQFTDYSTDKIALKVVLDLIKKLQKENEEYKLLNANIEKANRIIEGKEEYIPKNKIREKLEKIEKEKEQYYAAGQHLMYMLLKNQLKSLLEEE